LIARLKGIALASCLLAAGGCMRSGGSPMGIPLREMTRFESEWKNYQRLRNLKALAVAGDLNGVYASGFAYAYPVQALANDEALENCEERRVDLRIEDECRLYAIGNDRVTEAGIE
jgi:hypothetical protein